MKKASVFILMFSIVAIISCTKEIHNPVNVSPGLPDTLMKIDSLGNQYIFSLNQNNNLYLTILPEASPSDSIGYKYSDLDSVPDQLYAHVFPVFVFDSVVNPLQVIMPLRVQRETQNHPADFVLTNIDLASGKVYNKTFEETSKDDSTFDFSSVKLWFNNTVLAVQGTFDEIINDTLPGRSIVCYNMDLSERSSKPSSTDKFFYPGSQYLPINYDEYVDFNFGHISRTVVVPASQDLINNKGRKWTIDLNKINNLPDSSVSFTSYQLKDSTLTVQYSYTDSNSSTINKTGIWNISTGK